MDPSPWYVSAVLQRRPCCEAASSLCCTVAEALGAALWVTLLEQAHKERPYRPTGCMSTVRTTMTECVGAEVKLRSCSADMGAFRLWQLIRMGVAVSTKRAPRRRA